MSLRQPDPPLPLVFRTRRPPDDRILEHAEAPEGATRIVYRTDVRSLRGMQKEAMVAREAPGASAWRLISDEGPYLEGDDLAPPPLSFFAAGLQFCFITRFLSLARRQGLELRAARFVQDTWYSMTGSILKGDMTGGARPVDVLLDLQSDAPSRDIVRLARASGVASPGHAMMREVLSDTFSLNLNGRDVPVVRVRQSPRKGIADPEPRLAATRPAAIPPREVIIKEKAIERIEGVEGGASTSLRPVQNRQLNVRSEGKLLDAPELKESVATLVSPLGSTFRFLSDEAPADGGRDEAPDALAHLSAGLGFCYMTQLGRYAKIVKLSLRSFRIVQYTSFLMTGSASDRTLCASAEPVDTHVFVDSDESEETAQKLVAMGEQTCFLHAAMRGSFPSNIHLRLNGETLALD